MARNTTLGAVGLRGVYVGVRDDDGTYSIPTSVTPGDAYCGIKAHKSKALNITPPDPTTVPMTGDDSTWATFYLAPSDSDSGELRLGVLDTALLALVTSVEEVSSGYRTMAALSTDKVGTESSVIVWGWRRAKTGSPDEATFGSDAYETFIYPNAFLYAKPSGAEEQQPTEMVYNMTANKTTVDFLGRTLTEVTNGCTEAAGFVVHTTNQPFLEVFEGTGATSTFTLTKGAAVVHNDSNSPITCTIDGTERAVTVDASGVMTVSGAAPTNGAKVAVFYEYV